MATSMEAFKMFRRAGVVVVADIAKKEASKLPPAAKSLDRAIGGSIPQIFVTSPDGQKEIQGYSYSQISKDMRGVVRELKEKLEGQSFSDSETSTTSSPSSQLAAQQNWTNSEGKTISAAVQSTDGTTVVFILPNKRVVPYPLTNLSEESQKRILALKAASTSD